MDVTEVILRDHEWFRRQFITLFDLATGTDPDVPAIEALWNPLAARLDVHAAGEEAIFYPQLLARPEPEVRRIAQRYVDEMGGLREDFAAYTRRWTSSQWCSSTQLRCASSRPRSSNPGAK